MVKILISARKNKEKIYTQNVVTIPNNIMVAFGLDTTKDYDWINHAGFLTLVERK